MQRKLIGFILLCIPLTLAQATANLVATWQSATYFYQNQAIRYYYFDLQTQGGLAPAGTYQVNCQIAGPAPKACVTQLLTIPNQQNAIQQCLPTPGATRQYCLLFSPCQNNVNCNTLYYQSSNCHMLTFTNRYTSAWYSAGRLYYLVSTATVAPAILCTYSALR